MTLLADIARTSQSVADEPARLAKIRLIANQLRSLAADEIAIGAHYLSGSAPQGRFGIGYSALSSSADVGISAIAPALTLAETDHRLAAIATMRGAGAAARRAEALRNLFALATSPERDFLLRLLTGELRQGALAGVMTDAIAAAADLPVAPVRRAMMYAKDIGAVAQAALFGGERALSAFGLEILSPIAPMLAQTASDPADALRELGGEAAFEWKMDGARIQLHKSGEAVRVYTRNLNEVGDAVPEIIEAARAWPVHDVILDGEAIALDSRGRPLPFQITMRRFGRKLDVDALRAELPMHAFYFDCLRLDGESLIDRPTRERHAALDVAIDSSRRMPRIVTSSEREAQAFYEAALAAGHEGVMAKSLDAPYEAGSRGASWRKIKRAHTLDLVVIAAEWGHGRRAGKLSNLHLGALDTATGAYVMLGKTFKGLTDAMLEWQTRVLLAREIARDGYTVYVRPELVAEIAFSDVQASPRYPGGFALRLARVKRYRTDKRADEADTIDAVRRIHAAQG
ncbi:MAG TPA: ATP-dependent DNA ligase [Rhodanobacteraceae bacterium]|nr:ATP-dependent DNA ligase [Rhodanobacteraceae bacterium]